MLVSINCLTSFTVTGYSLENTTLIERKQNDEKGEERAIVRQIRGLAGSIIMPVSKHYENRIIFTILFTLQESR